MRDADEDVFVPVVAGAPSCEHVRECVCVRVCVAGKRVGAGADILGDARDCDLW